MYPPLGALNRPISLFIGRVRCKNNIDTLLDLDVSGGQVVCGNGPPQATLREQCPDVYRLGPLPLYGLAQ